MTTVQSFTLSDFSLGDRVQLHPATSRWMRGDRYGAVVGFGSKCLRVKLDRSGTETFLSPRNVVEILDRSRPDASQEG